MSYCNFDDPAGGTLTLADGYVPGTYTEDPEDFVSYSYFYYVPSYQEEPRRYLVSGTVTRESLEFLGWMFDPESYLVIFSESFNPVTDMGTKVGSRWDISIKYTGIVTSFSLRPQSVPEPGSMGLLALALGLSGLLRRRSNDEPTV